MNSLVAVSELIVVRNGMIFSLYLLTSKGVNSKSEAGAFSQHGVKIVWYQVNSILQKEYNNQKRPIRCATIKKSKNIYNALFYSHYIKKYVITKIAMK